MDEVGCCKWFVHQLKHDQIYAENKIKYSIRWRTFAQMLFQHTCVYYSPEDSSDEWRELVEFIDGNGFMIIHKEVFNPNTFKVAIEME